MGFTMVCLLFIPSPSKLISILIPGGTIHVFILGNHTMKGADRDDAIPREI